MKMTRKVDCQRQELDGILYAITILDDDPAQNNNLASLLSDGPGGTGLAEGDYGKCKSETLS